MKTYKNNAIQPDYLPFVTERDYNYEGTSQKRIFNFLPYDMLHQEDRPRRHLSVLGLFYYKIPKTPIRWLIINKNHDFQSFPNATGNNKTYPLYDLSLIDHVEYQDVVSIYGEDNLPEEPYMKKEIWIEAFARLFKERIGNIGTLDAQRLHYHNNYTGFTFADDIPVKLCGNNLESSAFITYQLTEAEMQKISIYGRCKLDDKVMYPTRWMTYSELLREYQSEPECFDTGLRRVLNYFKKFKFNEQKVEQEVTGIINPANYYTSTPSYSRTYTIHIGGPYQNPTAPFTDESDYYEVPEEKYSFCGTLGNAREKARQIVAKEEKGNYLFEHDIKSLSYWITDENETVYL